MPITTTTLAKSGLRTTTSALHPLASFPVPDNSSVRTELTVVARATDGTTATWRVEACCKRTGGGIVVMVQGDKSVVEPRRDGAASGWSVQANPSGNSLQVQVKGDPSLAVDWQVTGSLVLFAPA